MSSLVEVLRRRRSVRVRLLALFGLSAIVMMAAGVLAQPSGHQHAESGVAPSGVVGSVVAGRQLAVGPPIFSEARAYRDIKSLYNASDVVVEGTVESSQVGRTVGPPEDGVDDGVSFLEVVLRPTRTLASPGRPAPETLVLEMAVPPPFEIRWWESGDRVLLFAWEKRDVASGGRFWRAASLHGAFLIVQDSDDVDKVVPAGPEGPIRETWMGRPLAELVESIEAQSRSR